MGSNPGTSRNNPPPSNGSSRQGQLGLHAFQAWCPESARLARRGSHHLTGLRVGTKLARSALLPTPRMVSRDWETCKARLSSSHGPESGDEAGKVSFDTPTPRMVSRDWETCKAGLSSSHGSESRTPPLVRDNRETARSALFPREIGKIARRVSCHLSALTPPPKMVSRDWQTCKVSPLSSHGPGSRKLTPLLP